MGHTEYFENRLPCNQYNWYEVRAYAESIRNPSIGKHAETVRDPDTLWPHRWIIRIVQNPIS